MHLVGRFIALHVARRRLILSPEFCGRMAAYVGAEAAPRLMELTPPNTQCPGDEEEETRRRRGGDEEETRRRRGGDEEETRRRETAAADVRRHEETNLI